MSSVHIVALGARTPIGLRAESVAAAVRAGISKLRELPTLAEHDEEPATGAYDPLLDVTLPLPERLLALTLHALDEVVQKLRQATARLPKLAVFLALPEARPGFDELAAGALLEGLAVATRRWDVELTWFLSGRGHAGAVVAVQHTKRLLAAGDAELCVVGGVDSYHDAQTLEALLVSRQLAAPGVRAGFPPAEGAGFLALASDTALRSFRLGSLATLCAAHTAQEPNLSADDRTCRADGLIQAVLGACEGLELPDEAPGMVLCDINGERFRTEEWSLLQTRIGARLRTSDYLAPVSCWGDLGAASVPLLVLLACRSWARGYATDSRALIWAASNSGLRGALVLQQPQTR